MCKNDTTRPMATEDIALESVDMCEVVFGGEVDPPDQRAYREHRTKRENPAYLTTRPPPIKDLKGSG